jgi:hypothetical protein
MDAFANCLGALLMALLINKLPKPFRPSPKS